MSTPVSCPNCGTVQDLLRALLPPIIDSSAPNHLLETNDPPLEAEIQTTRETIAKEEDWLRILDENIAHVQSVLGVLLQKRDECEDKIRRYTSISLLRRFPPEILCNIFLFTLLPAHEMEDLPQERFFNFGNHDSPWILPRICSRWRSISLSFPSLWTTVIISPTYERDTDSPKSDDSSVEVYCRSGGSVPYPVEMFKAQLTRSGSAPLSVVLKDEGLSTDALRALLDSSTRWESLNCPKHGNLIPNLSGKVPLLRKIHLGGKASRREIAMQVLDAPALQEVSLKRYKSPIILPRSQITRYQASGRWSLPRMVNLLECHLDVSNNQPFPTKGTILTLPTLRKLYLYNKMIPPAIPDTLLVPPGPFPP
ncbi:hypothetical protein B0H19DRAFT_321400 [Mycena capillaripes]|nr:hypothetical protein B0H19DRAFT_321400 [Mycena capillaripes]